MSARAAPQPARRHRDKARRQRASSRNSPGVAPDLRVAETIRRVIVDHSYRLHERITDRRADEAEAALLEVFAHRIADCGLCGQVLQRFTLPIDRLAVDKSPDVAVEAAEFLLDI